MLTQTTTFNQSMTVLYSADVSAASITNPIPKVAAPSGNGVFLLNTLSDNSMASGPNNVGLVFFGTGLATQTATARVTGWRQVGSGATALWVPVPLLALNLTIGSQTGVAGQVIDATHLFVTTITASTAYTSANEIISPGDNTCAEVKVDTHGMYYLQVDLAKGTCTAVNCAAFGF